jgi:hypothetical protein
MRPPKQSTETQADSDWNDLKVLLALSRGGSVVGAARALHVDQSTVSRRLAALEETLGCALLIRGGREFCWTAEGRTMIGAAEAAEAAVLAGTRRLRSTRLASTGVVRVSTTPGTRTRDVGLQFFRGRVHVDLELHLVAVRIGVVHRHRQAVVHAPVGLDAGGLELAEVFQQVRERAVGVGDMVYTDQAAAVGLHRVGPDGVEVDQREPMVLVIEGEEGPHRVFGEDLRPEHRLVPVRHLLETAGAVDDVGDLQRAGEGHGGLLGWKAPGSRGAMQQAKPVSAGGWEESMGNAARGICKIACPDEHRSTFLLELVR